MPSDTIPTPSPAPSTSTSTSTPTPTSITNPSTPSGNSTSSPYLLRPLSPTDTRPIFFFDIDNCLYPRSLKIHDQMKTLINAYFRNHLHHPPEKAHHLRRTYYTTYGLALSGLLANPHHHHPVTIDPMHYNTHVDDALPLEKILKPIPELTALLQDIYDAGRVKMWLLTNAYINHARRVIRLLDIERFFDGITYCDYGEGGRIGRLICKPDREMYDRAIRDATGCAQGEQQTWAKKCYFVDDSYVNCAAAYALGWERTVHLLEPEDPEPGVRACKYQVRGLGELRRVFPEIFDKQEKEGKVEIGRGEMEERNRIEGK